MIQINSLKLPCGHSKEELEEKICKQLKISRSHLKSWKILRQSIDARKKPELFFVYLIEAEGDNERTIVKKLLGIGSVSDEIIVEAAGITRDELEEIRVHM